MKSFFDLRPVRLKEKSPLVRRPVTTMAIMNAAWRLEEGLFFGILTVATGPSARIFQKTYCNDSICQYGIPFDDSMLDIVPSVCLRFW